MAKIEASINDHDALEVFDWARNFLTQAQTGAESGVGGTTRKHRKVSLDTLRSLLVEVANVVNGLTTEEPGKVLDARQGKVLSDAIALRELLANKVASFQAEPDDTHYPTEKLVKDALDVLTNRIDNILEGQDLDPNKDVELLDSRHSNVSDETYESLGKRLDGIDDSYNRMASWSAKRFGLRFYTDTGEFARIGDAAGMVHRNHAGSYTPGVYSDFSFEDPWGGIKPCKMDDDGHILGWYGDPGYELLDGDEMAFIPRVFTGWTGNVVEGRPCIDIEASPAQLPGLYPTGFIGMNGELLRGIYVGRTKLGMSGGKLKSGAGLAPVTNKSMNSFNTDLRAKSTTAKWRLHDFTAWMVQTTLMAIEVGTFDVKTAIGPGIQGLSDSYSASNVCTVATVDANTFIMAKSRSQYFKVGMMVQIGTAHTNNNIASNRTITEIAEYDETNDTVTVDGAPFTTTITSTIATWGQPVPAENMDALKGESGYITRFGSASQSNVCWRWIWDLWGNVWEWLGGVLRVDGKFYLCFNRDDYQSSTPVGKAGWIDTGYAPVAENGYQREREVITYRNGQISLPKTTGGSGVGANSWYASYLSSFGADYQTGVRAVLVSGVWNSGAGVSPFFWNGSNGPSDAFLSFGARAVIEQEAA